MDKRPPETEPEEAEVLKPRVMVLLLEVNLPGTRSSALVKVSATPAVGTATFAPPSCRVLPTAGTCIEVPKLKAPVPAATAPPVVIVPIANTRVPAPIETASPDVVQMIVSVTSTPVAGVKAHVQLVVEVMTLTLDASTLIT